ncbi:MAG: hypothetical protein OXF11_06490 [Deltaproteobacteria bacterium]|nr:hypothetical protein [Deltaproteobacteria bacterium]
MAKANRKRPPTRKRKPQGRRGWLLIPVIILAVMLGWLYRHEIVNLVSFRFEGIDFSRRPAENARSGQGGDGITEGERKELEKILQSQ